MRKAHMIELSIDGKTIKTEASDLLLKIDGLLIYKLHNVKIDNEVDSNTPFVNFHRNLHILSPSNSERVRPLGNDSPNGDG